MRDALAASAVAAIAVLAACGGKQVAAPHAERPFDCRDRSVGYVETGGIRAAEVGVQVDCAEQGPRIHGFQRDTQGNRSDDAHSLTPAEFEEVWKQIDGVGWTNLHDCKASKKTKDDPVYAFSIRDEDNKATFRCQARDLPYPYNDLVDPLDQAAARSGHDAPESPRPPATP